MATVGVKGLRILDTNQTVDDSYKIQCSRSIVINI